MAIATTTALLIGSGIAAATQVYGAKKAGEASDKATDAQTTAADEALRVAEEQYALERSDLAPYRNAGQWSIGEMGRMVGMPEGWSLAPTFTKDDIIAAKGAGSQIGATEPASQFTDENRFPFQRAGAAGPHGGPLPETLRDLQQLGAQQQTRSSFVRIQAPDGEERDVSPEQADYLVSRGARRIG